MSDILERCEGAGCSPCQENHCACVLIDELEGEYRQLLNRYDDAMKRIQDMQAELEYLRMEANRQ